MKKPYYPNLEAEMAREGIQQKDISNLLYGDCSNGHINAVNRRLTGQIKLNIDEIKIIRSTYFAEMTLDYLFINRDELINEKNLETA